MTPEEAFRANDLMRSELLGSLENPAFKACLLLYEARQRKIDVLDDSTDPIASARVLSRRVGGEMLIDFLYEQTQPLPPPPQEDPEPDHGITPEELAAVTPRKQ